MDSPESLGPTTAAALAAAGTVRRFRAGAVLFHEGDPSEHVALITAGRVKIVAGGDNGAESVLAVRGPGDLVGELSAIDGRPRSATARALERVEAVLITGPALHQVLAEHPGAALALLRTVVGRLRDSDRRRVEFGSAGSLTRLARRLVALADEYGRPEADGSIRIGLPVTQEELAGWVGASRESVARAFAALRTAGILTTGRRTVTILDAEGLRRMAG